MYVSYIPSQFLSLIRVRSTSLLSFEYILTTSTKPSARTLPVEYKKKVINSIKLKKTIGSIFFLDIY